MTLPNANVYMRPDSPFAVEGNSILGTSTLGASPTGNFVLGPTARAFVNLGLSSALTKVSVSRGRSRVSDSFEAGTASFELVDTTGAFNTQNTSSPLYPYVLPVRQIKITVVINLLEYTIFEGFTTRFSYRFEPGVNATFVSVECVDAFHILSKATVETISTFAGNNILSSNRILGILREIVDSTSARLIPELRLDIGSGVTNVTDDPDIERTALDAVRQVENTENGAFFMSRTGKFTFYGRHYLQQLASGNPTTPLVFDESTGLKYLTITEEIDDETVFNEYDISGVELTDGANISEDSASQQAYGKKNYFTSESLLMTDAEAKSFTEFMLGFRKEPELVVSAISFNTGSYSAANQQIIAETDLLCPVTVTKSYYGSSNMTTKLTIQGINHELTPSDWITSYSLSEPVGGNAMILDYGILDTNILSY